VKPAIRRRWYLGSHDKRRVCTGSGQYDSRRYGYDISVSRPRKPQVCSGGFQGTTADGVEISGKDPEKTVLYYEPLVK